MQNTRSVHIKYIFAMVTLSSKYSHQFCISFSLYIGIFFTIQTQTILFSLINNQKRKVFFFAQLSLNCYSNVPLAASHELLKTRHLRMILIISLVNNRKHSFFARPLVFFFLSEGSRKNISFEKICNWDNAEYFFDIKKGWLVV